MAERGVLEDRAHLPSICRTHTFLSFYIYMSCEMGARLLPRMDHVNGKYTRRLLPSWLAFSPEHDFDRITDEMRINN